MGFLRQGQPPAFDRAALKAVIVNFIGEREIAEVLRSADPFGIDDPCPFNPSGHRFFGSCGDIACVHCAKVAWS